MNPLKLRRILTVFFDLDSNTQSLRVVHDNPAVRITSITARRYSKRETETDGDNSPLDFFTVNFDGNATVFTQELRLQSPVETERFQWLLGGYFESRELNEASNFTLGIDSGSPGSNLSDFEIDETTFAGFGQMSYELIEALTLTAGLRYETNNSTLENLDNVFVPTGGSAFPGFSVDDIEQESDAWLPRFAVQYRFNPNLMAYGSITRGYRPAGVNGNAEVEEAIRFEAERSWNYEVGLKTSWLNDRLQANLAFFHNDVDDFQVQFPRPIDNVLFISNAGARITGGEFEVRATPADGLDVIAGFGFVDGELTDLTNPFTGETSDASDLLFAPNFTYNLAVQYRSSIGVFGRLELVGFGPTVFDEDSTVEQASFALVNARLGYEFDRYGLYFFVNNLFDTEYITQGTPFPPFGTVVAYGAPATYGFQIRTRF